MLLRSCFKGKKKLCVIVLLCASAQQTVAAAISVYSGFLSAAFWWSAPPLPPDPINPPLTVVKVLKKHRVRPSPLKMQNRHSELWIHGLFSTQATFPIKLGINVNVECGHGLNSTSTISVCFYCGDAALGVRLRELTPLLRWCNFVAFTSFYLLLLAFYVLNKCAHIHYWS